MQHRSSVRLSACQRQGQFIIKSFQPWLKRCQRDQSHQVGRGQTNLIIGRTLNPTTLMIFLHSAIVGPFSSYSNIPSLSQYWSLLLRHPGILLLLHLRFASADLRLSSLAFYAPPPPFIITTTTTATLPINIPLLNNYYHRHNRSPNTTTIFTK